MGNGFKSRNLGFDQSDGPTRNTDGGFVNNATQWETTTREDPKKIRQVTQRAEAFLDSCAKEKRPFFCKSPTTPFTAA